MITKTSYRMLSILFISWLMIPTLSAANSEAVALINKNNLSSNLPKMALQVIRKSQTFRGMVSKIGEQKSEKVIAKHLEIQIGNHILEWNRNLAEAHLEFFTLPEMRSIFKEKGRSPFFKAYRKVKKDINHSMRNKSGDLFTKIVTKTLQNAYLESASSDE
jgi:hypothetical protein